MADPKLCALDLDGTLVDSQHHIVAAMAAGFAEIGEPAPAAALVRQVVGLPLDTAVERLGPHLDRFQVERVGEVYREAYFEAKGSTGRTEPLFPGTLEALDALQAEGWSLAVVTGKGRRGLISVLEGHGLSGRFMALKSADDGPGKPDPTLLLEAMAEAGAAPERAVMVGDTTFDMGTAVNARIPAIGVSWGYHDPTRLREAGAVAILDRFDQLAAQARRLIGE